MGWTWDVGDVVSALVLHDGRQANCAKNWCAILHLCPELKCVPGTAYFLNPN
jgi:hypothetical protein